jgi:hypothetical protein
MRTKVEAGPGSYKGTYGEAVADDQVMIAVKISDSKLYKASDAAGYRVLGINKEEVDAIGDIGVVLDRDAVFMDNSATQPVTAASLGNICYVEDEETVCIAAGSTTSLIAGIVREVANDQVLVDFSQSGVGAVSST